MAQQGSSSCHNITKLLYVLISSKFLMTYCTVEMKFTTRYVHGLVLYVRDGVTDNLRTENYYQRTGNKNLNSE